MIYGKLKDGGYVMGEHRGRVVLLDRRKFWMKVGEQRLVIL